MIKQKLVIYVPGLGGRSILEKQREVTKKWVSSERDVLFLEPSWQSNESYQDKKLRLQKTIELHTNKYHRVQIIGTSAGGTLGLNLYASLNHANKSFTSVCGKIIGAKAIGLKYSQPHPALVPSVRESEEIIKNNPEALGNVTSYRPLIDEVVLPRFMKVPGANNKLIPLFFHIPSIWIMVSYFYKVLLKD